MDLIPTEVVGNCFILNSVEKHDLHDHDFYKFPSGKDPPLVPIHWISLDNAGNETLQLHRIFGPPGDDNLEKI